MSPLLKRFARCRAGIAATEFVLLAPVLIMLMLGGLTVFQYIDGSYRSEQSTAIVGDLVSRQVQVDDALLDQMTLTFARLFPNHAGRPQVRITSLFRSDGKYETRWSYNSAAGSLSKTALPIGDLPDIAEGDSVILTETAVTLRYPFDVSGISRSGLATFMNAAVTRPRFVPLLAKVD